MRKAKSGAQGRLETLILDSKLLGDNLLGDPARRQVAVYLPPGHDGRGLPLLVDLAGFTGSGLAHLAWKNFGENLPERLDRLIAGGTLPPVAVALPDCFTRLGGNQYIDSLAMGPWERFLIEEMVPLVERQFGCGGAARRGVFGKSSGGYGAMVQALRRPDFWAAAACHSGDMGFDLCYLPEFPKVLRALDRHQGSIEAFVTAFEAALKPDGKDVEILMALAMCATYDPDPKAFLGIRLPVDLKTCEAIPERWDRWRAWDPLTLVETLGPGLKKLKALFIDCGDRDQYNLLYGARRLTRALTRLGVAHRYEEFPDDHTAIDYRLDVSLPFVARALSA
ncbi:MAG: alpha/beta hydrolase [Kiloniellales bacterium]